MSRTPNEVLQARVGRLVFEISTLESENANLRERIVEIVQMLPPEKRTELQARAKEVVASGSPGPTTPPGI